MYKVAVIGASGYTGAELLAALAQHSSFELVLATSDSLVDTKIGDYYPTLAQSALADLPFCQHAVLNDYAAKGSIDLAFLAVPHGKSLDLVPALLQQKVAAIDLSGSYRLKDAAVYQQYYGHPHTSPELLQSAIYGLPELNRSQLRSAGQNWLANKESAPLITAPGCFPTAIALAALPLLSLSNFDHSFGIVANALTGISGAGRAAVEGGLQQSIAENMYAYNPLSHRHTPEIQQILDTAALSAENSAPVNLSFVPHLVPVMRGMVATITARLENTIDEITLHKIFADYYQASHFIKVLPSGKISEMPQSQAQTGSNRAQIGLKMIDSADGQSQTIISSCAIDNLGKGASYQAVQCANLLIGVDEQTGLEHIQPII